MGKCKKCNCKQILEAECGKAVGADKICIRFCNGKDEFTIYCRYTLFLIFFVITRPFKLKMKKNTTTILTVQEMVLVFAQKNRKYFFVYARLCNEVLSCN